MACLTSTAIIKGGKVNAAATIQSGLTSAAQIVTYTTSTAIIKGGKINAALTLQSGLTSAAQIIASGVNPSACPIILCVDGGAASTVSFPSVNGLLNGGTA